MCVSNDASVELTPSMARRLDGTYRGWVRVRVRVRGCVGGCIRGCIIGCISISIRECIRGGGCKEGMIPR